MKNRLFTFGCSFTKFKWPTWADIISKDFDEFQNWGQSGAGNCFVLWSLMESIQRNKINSSDTVAIMWTSVGREDRWVNGSWTTPGSIYRETPYNPYSTDFIQKFADPDGYLIRDMANISAAKKVLDSIGCRYYMTSMVPFQIASEVHQSLLQKIKSKLTLITGQDDDSIRDEQPIDSKRVMSVYKDVLESVRPSVFEVIFENDWFSRNGFGKGSQWVKDDYEKARISWAKEKNWPAFKDLLARKVDEETLESIKKTYHFSDLSTFIDNIDSLEKRNDFHPTPIEHLEYVKKVLPEFNVSEETNQWVKDMHDRAERGVFYTSNHITRF